MEDQVHITIAERWKTRTMTRAMEDLATWATPEETCLLLGAGASIPSGGPSGAALMSSLVGTLSADLAAETDLALGCEIIENQFGRRPLVEAVISAIRAEPTGGLAELPKYPWKSIFTTNYDQLLEVAANDLGVPTAVVRSKYDLPALENLGALRIFKIHGCVSQDRALGDPSSLVLTRGDYRKVRDWKSDLLQRMQVEMETSKVLVIGQSLADLHLDEIVDDLADLQEEIGFRGRVSVLTYTADPNIERLYASRGIEVTTGDIDWFASELARSASVSERARAGGASTPATSPELLPSTIRPVTLDVAHAIRLKSPVRKMFSGSPATYFDIAKGRTFERDQVAPTCDRLENTGLAVIAAAAGLGKTTLARQVALARREANVRAFEHRTDLPLDVDAWRTTEERLRARGERGLLLLDNATKYQRQTNDLLRRLPPGDERALEILITAERHRWDRLSKHPSLLRIAPISVGRLSRDELRRLLRVASDNDEVRSLVPASFASLPDEDRLLHLRRTCSSDIFVCLRNIFATGSFDAIILDEFRELDESLQDVYRLVAGLEAISGGSHRQLVLRMLGLRHDSIPNLLDEMDGLLVEAVQGAIVDGVFIWRTRHPQIADIVTRYKYSDPDSHLALVEDFVQHLNPTVDIERNAIRGLCNETLGLDFVRDSEARVRILEQLADRLPDDHVLRHRLVREFLRRGEFAEAESILEKAIDEVGIDPPLLRYRVELYRSKARHEPGLMDEDREALLRWAWAECQTAVNTYSDNWFTYRSLLEVAVDWLELTGEDGWLEQAVDDATEAYSRLFEPNLLRHLQAAERRLGQR